MDLGEDPLCLLPEGQHRFGRYRLLYRFAAGGMASLYLARLSGTDGFEKIVAIKVMHGHLSRDRELAQMFVDEARLASRISHPNVVQILELGRFGGSHFIAMEYVDGESVLELLRRTRPTFEVAAHIVAEAAAGLHAAHELRDDAGRPLEVVHRDVSPDNILLSFDGAVKLTDFGVARARDRLCCTTARTIKGKLSYMSPEQASGAPIDRRSDIFSLGVVLYELTVGRRLFRRDGEAETLRAVERCAIPRPTEQVRDYPRALERILFGALQRDPARRLPTARALQEALEGFVHRAGRPVTRAALGEMLSRLFADRIERRRRARRRLAQSSGCAVPDLDPATNSSAGLPAISIVLERDPSPPRWWLRTSALLAALTVGCLAGMLYRLPRRDIAPETRARTQAPARPSTARAVPRPPSPFPAREPDRPGRNAAGTSTPRGQVTVAARATRRRPTTLPATRRSPRPGKGTIRFHVKPGVHVQLDGRPLGRAPLAPVMAREGPHLVVVTDPFRYQQQRVRVVVRRERTTWVSQAW